MTSEGPALTARIGVADVHGLQVGGVAACEAYGVML